MMIERQQGETWRQAAGRIAEKHGLKLDVLGVYDRLSPNNPQNADAAWAACQEWDVIEIV